MSLSIYIYICRHLGVNRSLPQSSLEVPEDGGDRLHLRGGEDVLGPGGGAGAQPGPAVAHHGSAHGQPLERRSGDLRARDLQHLRKPISRFEREVLWISFILNNCFVTFISIKIKLIQVLEIVFSIILCICLGMYCIHYT